MELLADDEMPTLDEVLRITNDYRNLYSKQVSRYRNTVIGIIEPVKEQFQNMLNKVFKSGNVNILIEIMKLAIVFDHDYGGRCGCCSEAYSGTIAYKSWSSEPKLHGFVIESPESELDRIFCELLSTLYAERDYVFTYHAILENMNINEGKEMIMKNISEKSELVRLLRIHNSHKKKNCDLFFKFEDDDCELMSKLSKMFGIVDETE